MIEIFNQQVRSWIQKRIIKIKTMLVIVFKSHLILVVTVVRSWQVKLTRQILRHKPWSFLWHCLSHSHSQHSWFDSRAQHQSRFPIPFLQISNLAYRSQNAGKMSLLRNLLHTARCTSKAIRCYFCCRQHIELVHLVSARKNENVRALWICCRHKREWMLRIQILHWA